MSFVYEQLRFLVRGGTAANLATVNEIPLKRELVIETDTLRYKLGDGVTAWSALPYASGGGSTWRDGAGAPSNSLGANGDYYLRTSNGAVYAKAAGVYTVVANIKGNDGAAVEMQVAGGYIQWRLAGSPPPAWINLLDLALVTGPQGDKGDKGDVGAAGPSSACFPTASFDGGDAGEDITVGTRTLLYVPFGFTIAAATMTSFDVGTLVVDIRVKPYALHPPTPLDSICSTTPPSILSDRKGKDTTLAGWTVDVPADSVMEFVVTACTGINKATLVLTGEREIP